MDHPAQADTDLTLTEKDLRTRFGLGEPLDLDQRDESGTPDGRTGETWRRIRGEVLRELLLSPAPPGDGQIALCVTGANVVGPVDLRYAKIDCPIRLENCWFDSPVTLSEAELRSVSFRYSRGTTIDARHVRVAGDLVLERVRLTGQLRLGGAHLEDDLHLVGATVEAPDHGDQPGARVEMDNLEVKGTVQADGLTVAGTLSTEGARVAGTMQLRNGHLGRTWKPGEPFPDGVAWSGDGLDVGGELDARGLRAGGKVSLIDGRVQTLVLRGARITAASRALTMDRLDCAGSLFCEEMKLTGGMHAIGINVGATVYLRGTELRASAGTGGDDGWALNAQRARISDDLKCRTGFHAVGTVDLTGARIDGSAEFDGAWLEPVEGGTIGFTAGRARIGANLSARKGFACDGLTGLVNTRVGGWIVLDDRREATVRQPFARITGPRPHPERALLASGLQVGRYATIRTRGRIDLSGSEITGNLTVDLGGLDSGSTGAREPRRPAADLSAVTAQVLWLRGWPRQGYVDLTQASVRTLLDSPGIWRQRIMRLSRISGWPGRALPAEHSLTTEATRTLAVLDGLRYDDIVALDEAEPATVDRPVRDRLDWLEAGTQVTRAAGVADGERSDAPARYQPVGFAPQPYQQLAAVYRRNGRDADAREVLHAMYCRQSATMHRRHPVVRLWDVVQNATIGYGYRPLRALAWILSLVAATSIWFTAFDPHHIGLLQAAILSLGLALPGSGLNTIEGWVQMGPLAHVLAVVLVVAGLVLGATVITAIGRVVRS